MSIKRRGSFSGVYFKSDLTITSSIPGIWYTTGINAISRILSSNLVTKLHHTALVGFHVRQVEGGVSVKLLEELDPITNQDRQNRITNFVGKSEAKAFGGDYTASNKPDGTEGGPQTLIHELREIARVELDGIPGSRQFAMSKDEGGFVAVRPPKPFGLETQRGLIRSRSHDVAVDRFEERLDEFWVHSVPVYEFV